MAVPTLHSAGPLRAVESTVIDAEGHTVCEASRPANATLFACAPDMLELLLEIYGDEARPPGRPGDDFSERQLDVRRRIDQIRLRVLGLMP